MEALVPYSQGTQESMKQNVFQDTIYIKQTLELPEENEEPRSFFHIKENTAAILTTAHKLLLVDIGSVETTKLICSYYVDKILVKSKLVSSKSQLDECQCFYLKDGIFAFKLVYKIVFLPIWDHKDHCFDLVIPKSHLMFQLNSNALLSLVHNHVSGDLHFLWIKWETLQMKYLAYSSRVDPVDILLIDSENKDEIDAESTLVRRLRARSSPKKHKQKFGVIAFLNHGGLIEFYDIYLKKVVSIAMPRRNNSENFSKIFYFAESSMLVQASNARFVVWNCQNNCLKPEIYNIIEYKFPFNPTLTRKLSNFLFLVNGNTVNCIEPTVLQGRAVVNIVEDTYPNDAYRSECFEQKIKGIHPVGSAILIVERETRVLPQFLDDSIAEDPPAEIGEEGKYSFSKLILIDSPIRGLRLRDPFKITTQSDIYVSVQSTENFTSNNKGDIIFWNYESAVIRAVLASAPQVPGWQDHVFREIRYFDFSLWGLNYPSLVEFMSEDRVLCVGKSKDQQGLVYLLYSIDAQQSKIRKLADSRTKWPRANLIFPINETELIIQFERNKQMKIQKVNAFSGEFRETIIEDNDIMCNHQCWVINKAEQIFALTSLRVSILYVREKKLVPYNNLGHRITDLVPLRHMPLLALSLAENPPRIYFMKWTTGEIVTSYEIGTGRNNYIHLYGNLGRELLFSKGGSSLQGLLIDSALEKHEHHVLRKKSKELPRPNTFIDISLDDVSLKPVSEQSNKVFFHITGDKQAISRVNTNYGSYWNRIGSIQRIDKRLFALKLMKESIGKVHPYYTIKDTFLMLFPQPKKPELF